MRFRIFQKRQLPHVRTVSGSRFEPCTTCLTHPLLYLERFLQLLQAATVHAGNLRCPRGEPPLSRQGTSTVQAGNLHCPRAEPPLSTRRISTVLAGNLLSSLVLALLWLPSVPETTTFASLEDWEGIPSTIVAKIHQLMLVLASIFHFASDDQVMRGRWQNCFYFGSYETRYLT